METMLARLPHYGERKVYITSDALIVEDDGNNYVLLHKWDPDIRNHRVSKRSTSVFSNALHYLAGYLADRVKIAKQADEYTEYDFSGLFKRV